jgi:ribosomal protein S5
MSNYTDVFGGSTLPPSEFKMQALALTAATTLYWPYNYTGTGSILTKINVLSSTGAYDLTFPDATQVSTGEDTLIINNSAFTITLKDAAAGTIGTVAAGVSKYLYLSSNSTAAGTWGIFTYGTGTSAADASALAGYGTTATGATLSGAIPVTETAAAATINATTGRASSTIFTGGSVACTLPSAVTAGANFYTYVKNGGTGTITITPVGGQLIDNVATIGLNPQESCLVLSSGTDWHTIGLGRSTIYQFTKLVKDLTGIATYTLTSSDASNKLIQFTGAPSGATIVTVPAVVAIYYVEVSTSNAFTVTMKTAAGTGVALAQSVRSILYCDGVNVVSAQTASAPASQTAISNDTTTNAAMYPVWVAASAGDLPAYVSSTKMSFNPSTGTLTVTAISSTVTKATNLAGGSGGTIPYQSAADTTAMLANGTVNQLLMANGTTVAPSWTSTLNSAYAVGGTWTAAATWTLPAWTAGGTISGNGNQLNNVIIGTSTPLAGAFTTLSATGTSATAFNVQAAAAQTGVTAGDLVVDTTASAAKVNIGRLSTTVGDNTVLVVRDRLAAACMTIDTAYKTAVFGGNLSATGTAIDFVTSGTTLTVGVGANNGTVSAGVFTDRTKHFEGDALAELALVSGTNGEINHGTLPAFAQVSLVKLIHEDVEEEIEEEHKGQKAKKLVTKKVKVGEETVVERDLGAMISILTVAVQQLTTRLTALENK